MKIQCGVCEKAPATVICCADEEALCAACDVKVHAANKLASKHQRLLLDCDCKLPRCDICQDKLAFIFCVEDRALFCTECDKSIHIPGTLSGDHRRLLAAGIRVAISAPACIDKMQPKDPAEPTLPQPSRPKQPEIPKDPIMTIAQPCSPSTWAVEDFLQLSDYDSGDKSQCLDGIGDLEWFADIGSFFPDPVPEATPAMAEVPELPISTPYGSSSCKSHKSTPFYKKPRTAVIDDIEDFFTVPDLG